MTLNIMRGFKYYKIPVILGPSTYLFAKKNFSIHFLSFYYELFLTLAILTFKNPHCYIIFRKLFDTYDFMSND